MVGKEDARRNTFKQTVSSTDGRRRREETTRQIRKAKKDENLLKRRMMAAPSTITPVSSSDDTETMSGGKKAFYTVGDIPALTETLKSSSSSEQQQEEAIRGFRRILSVERNPPVDEVLQAGVLPDLIHHLLSNPHAHTKIFESAWALTNIASTSRTAAVVEGGAVGPLIQLLRHHNADVREQAAWCLGNIAGDNIDYRNYLLQENILEPLLMNVNEPANSSLLGNVVWAISNLCRGKPSPDLRLVANCIPALCHLLLKKQELPVDVVVDTVWALSYLSDGENERIQMVMSTGVTPCLVQFLNDKSSALLTPTIRCLGNFVTGNDEQTQAVLDAGIIDHLSELLASAKKSIRKETCWLISNITAGTEDQISQVMKNVLIRGLIDNATNSSWEVRKEAIWALANICTTGNDAQVMGLIQSDCLQAFVELLAISSADSSMLVVALEALEAILVVGERHGKDYCSLLDEYNGVDFLENLQEHPSDAVYQKTVHIIETFFGGEEEEDENLVPTMTDSGTFGFGLSSPKQLFPSDGSAPVFQFGEANRIFQQ